MCLQTFLGSKHFDKKDMFFNPQLPLDFGFASLYQEVILASLDQRNQKKICLNFPRIPFGIQANDILYTMIALIIDLNITIFPSQNNHLLHYIIFYYYYYKLLKIIYYYYIFINYTLINIICYFFKL